MGSDTVDAQAPSDEDLVKQVASGSRVALGALYDHYSPALLSQARRLLRSASEAEDLVHDVFLEVWRQAHTYETGRGSVRAWLAVRVRSRALDRLKLSFQSRRSSQDVNEVVELSAVEQDSTLTIDCEAVQRALALLSPDQRTVLEMFYFDGLSLPEIGERLSVPLGTVKSRASRAIARLRAELSGEPDLIDAA